MVSEKVDIDKNQCALPFDDYCRQGIEGLGALEIARRWTTFENRDCGEMTPTKCREYQIFRAVWTEN